MVSSSRQIIRIVASHTATFYSLLSNKCIIVNTLKPAAVLGLGKELFFTLIADV
ncbi:hypothetical protein [Panacibacter ginsenosidivorans]|uniref:hypothetical protein n=1 Tax=Panacibacter ginsenosidivorans TaxID=1813871 RepID=UPI001315986C|nr:hypothetical protein [Panacibacter ginsenosidivorans]